METPPAGSSKPLSTSDDQLSTASSDRTGPSPWSAPTAQGEASPAPGSETTASQSQ